MLTQLLYHIDTTACIHTFLCVLYVMFNGCMHNIRKSACNGCTINSVSFDLNSWNHSIGLCLTRQAVETK